MAKFKKCEHNEIKELVNITPATLTENGNITYICSKCEEEITETIYYPEIIQLSKDAYTYDGTEKTPTVSVTDSNGNIIDESNYTVEYSEGRINAGNYTVKINFKGNYEGSATETFTINKKKITPIINNIPKQKYTSEEIMPEVILKDGETILIRDVDYTLDYENNIDVGTATIKYCSTDESNYDVGTGEITFTIEPCTLFTPNVSLKITSYRVTGEEIKPEVEVMANGYTLEKDVDYEITYKNNIDVGTNAEVIVKGKGNYDGTAIVFFKIVPKDVLTIAGINNNQRIKYTGCKVELEGEATIDSDLIPEDAKLEIIWYNILGKKIETPTDVGKYYCMYKYEDADYVASLMVNVEITKGQSIPEITHFEGVVGDKLSSIVLPEGMAWVNASEDLTLGKNTYLATFTQNNDTKNFTTETVKVDVYVKSKVKVAVTREYDNGEVINKDENFMIEGTDCFIGLAPDEGYELSKLTINGEETNIKDYSLSFIVEKEEKIIVATYSKIKYVIEVGNNENVTITPQDKITVDYNGKVELTILANKGYKITSVKVNDEEMLSKLKNNVLTLENILENKKIVVTTEKISYEILEGANQTYTVDESKELVVKASGEINELVELRVDGIKLDFENYTIVSGSTIATLKSSYLNTLAEGEHILTFVYANGEVSTKFTIVKTEKVSDVTSKEENNTTEESNIEEYKQEENKSSDLNGKQNIYSKEETKSPQTGDNIVLWISIMVVAVIGFVGITIYIKNKK